MEAIAPRHHLPYQNQKTPTVHMRPDLHKHFTDSLGHWSCFGLEMHWLYCVQYSCVQNSPLCYIILLYLRCNSCLEHLLLFTENVCNYLFIENEWSYYIAVSWNWVTWHGLGFRCQIWWLMTQSDILRGKWLLDTDISDFILYLKHLTWKDVLRFLMYHKSRGWTCLSWRFNLTCIFALTRLKYLDLWLDLISVSSVLTCVLPVLTWNLTCDWTVNLPLSSWLVTWLVTWLLSHLFWLVSSLSSLRLAFLDLWLERTHQLGLLITYKTMTWSHLCYHQRFCPCNVSKQVLATPYVMTHIFQSYYIWHSSYSYYPEYVQIWITQNTSWHWNDVKCQSNVKLEEICSVGGRLKMKKRSRQTINWHIIILLFMR